MMDTQCAFFSITLIIILSFAVTLSSPEDPAQNSRASSTTYQLDSEMDSRPILEKLFEKYGKNGKMTFEGFEHLLENLGLGNVKIDDHDVHHHHSEEGFREFHLDHEH